MIYALALLNIGSLFLTFTNLPAKRVCSGKTIPFDVVTFETKVYHPNIHLNGEISIGILTYDWEPKIKLIDVLKTIQRILAEPEEKSFLNFDAAIQYKENKDAFIQKAKEWTQKYAIN